jgi:hypothetical protein
MPSLRDKRHSAPLGDQRVPAHLTERIVACRSGAWEARSSSAISAPLEQAAARCGNTHRRRLAVRRSAQCVLMSAGIVLALVLAPVAAAQSTSVEGSFTRGTIRPLADTCAGVLCGSGSLEPFGDAVFVYTPTSVQPVGRSCLDVTAVLSITLVRTGDTLELATESTACFPGNSPNTPGTARSWGNPVTDSGTWMVDSGTGTFEDATGDGTFVAHAAGAALSAQLSGELDLADN